MTRRVLTAALGGAALAAASYQALRARPPGGAERWTRTNHTGAAVTLLEGPAYAVAGSLAAFLAGGGPAGPIAGMGCAGFGVIDDLAGDSGSKGLRGHLSALRRGRLTTGSVKILGLAGAGVVAALVADGRGERSDPPSLLSSLVGGAVVAGSANLANLFDLRPGRALKVTVLAGVPLGIRGSVTAAAAAGAAAGLLPSDLAGRSMLGDTGANSAGALVGTALVERTGLRGRLLALAVLSVLTLASERVSFTTVIESTPGLRELDALGRSARS